MQKNCWVSIISILLLTNLFLITSQLNVSSSPAIIIQGYVYINDIMTVPDEVYLDFPEEIIFASVYDDGHYVIFLSYFLDPDLTGTFYVTLSDQTWAAFETFTLEEDIFDYDIDLHVDAPGIIPEEPSNIQPKAKADGPYYQTKNLPVKFDGSDSFDIDGFINKYEWDFGDGNSDTGTSPSHIYSESGVYRIKLFVTDNRGKTDLDITYVYITEIPSSPPSKPIINGTKFGDVKTQYNYKIYSTDPENNNISYYIKWNDNTDPTESQFLHNGTSYTTSHSWDYPGIYTVQVYAFDENNVVSKETQQVILIDTIYCEDIGYMTDYSVDDIYDLFYSNETGLETPLSFTEEIYLIDKDNDGFYDYQFNMTTFQISNYIEINPNKDTSSFIDLIAPFALYILIFIIMSLFLTMGVLVYKIRKKPKKEKGKEIKNKEKKNKKAKKEKKIKKEQKKEIETKKEPIEPKEKVKRVEDKIDELLTKKK